MASEGGWPVTALTTGTGRQVRRRLVIRWNRIAYASQGSIWVVSGRRRSAGGSRMPGGHGGSSPRHRSLAELVSKGKWILFETGRRGNSDLMVVSEDGARPALSARTDADETGAAWSPDGTPDRFCRAFTRVFSAASSASSSSMWRLAGAQRGRSTLQTPPPTVEEAGHPGALRVARRQESAVVLQSSG